MGMILDQEAKIPYAIGCDLNFFLIKKNKKENSIIFDWKWVIMFKYKNVNKHWLMLPHTYWKKYMFKVVLVGHVKLWSLYCLAFSFIIRILIKDIIDNVQWVIL